MMRIFGDSIGLDFLALLYLSCLIIVISAIFFFVNRILMRFSKNLDGKSDYKDLENSYKPESLVEDIPNSSCDKPEQHIVIGKIGEFVYIDGIKCVNFVSHDYFGFIGKKEIEDKAIESIAKYGVGTCGPRCFYGTNIEHLKLEAKLANFFSTQSSIIYPFGFATVASAISAYAKKGDIVFVDEKRNFAIQQGLVASRSEVLCFKHNSSEDLQQILVRVHREDVLNKKKARRSRRFLVLEGIYMNTGEVCPLPEFIKLSKIYKLRVFIDESISFGVLGKTGRGILEHFHIPRADVDLTMGSFENSLASGGGFCAGSKYLIDHQVLSGLGYCFSASLPSFLVTAAAEALDIIQDDPKIIEKLQICCKTMHDRLTASDMINRYFIISGGPESPVHLLTIRDSVLPQSVKHQLLTNFVNNCLKENIAIVKAARLETDDALQVSLRITTSVYHSEACIDHLVTIMQKMCENFPN